MHRVSPHEIGCIFVLIRIRRLLFGIPQVDGRALRPRSVRRCAEFPSEQSLGIALRIAEQIDHAVIQHSVITIAQQESPVNILGRRPHHILYVHHRIRGRFEIGRPVSEIEHIPVVKRLPEFFGIGIGHALRKVAFGKLTALVVTEIPPVLLNMHFIGIERRQVDALILILFHQPFQESGSVRVEIIHLLGFVFQHHHHPVITRQLRPVAVNPQQTRIHRRSRNLVAQRVGRLVLHLLHRDDVRRIDRPERTAPQRRFAERVSLDAGQLHRRLSLIVRPGELLPDRKTELSGLRIAEPDFVSHPAAAVPGLFLISRPQFERAEQTQADPHVVFGGKIADHFDLIDILVHIGSQFPFGTGILAILSEKFVECHDQLLAAAFFPLFADFAQTLHARIEPERNIDFFIGIRQIGQLPVAGQNDLGRLRPCRKRTEQQSE